MALYKHDLDKKLKASEKRYRAIAELAQDSILIFNPDYTIAYYNTYATRFFNITCSDDTPVNLKEIFPVDIVDPVKTYLETVFTQKQYERVTLHGMKEENEFWLDTIFVPIITDEDEVDQVIGLSRDVTIQTLFEKDMEKKGIIQIEKNMEQFQILNDEIRNPLAIIMSAASLIEDKKIEMIQEQVRLINDLVNQLDHGWIESEKVRAFLIKHYGHGKNLNNENNKELLV